MFKRFVNLTSQLGVRPIKAIFVMFTVSFVFLMMVDEPQVASLAVTGYLHGDYLSRRD